MQKLEIEGSLSRLLWDYYKLTNGPEKEQLSLSGLFPTPADLLDRITLRAVTFEDWSLVYAAIPLQAVRDLSLKRMSLLAVLDLQLRELFRSAILALAEASNYEPLPWGVGPYDKTLPLLRSDENVDSKTCTLLSIVDVAWRKIYELSHPSESLLLISRVDRYEPWHTMAKKVLEHKQTGRIMSTA